MYGYWINGLLPKLIIVIVGLLSNIKRNLKKGGLALYSLSIKKTVIVFIFIIITVSFAFFFYFQKQTEQSIRDSMLEQQKQNQKDTTKAIAQHIRLRNTGTLQIQYWKKG